MKISKKSINEILSVARIEDLFDDKVKAGKDYIAPCPFCGKSGKNKGISISQGKNIAKCFSCGEGGNPVNLLINRDHITYPDALKVLADKYNIVVDFDDDEQEEKARKERLNHEKEVKNKRKSSDKDKKSPSPSKEEKKSAKAREKLLNRKDFVDIQLEESGLTFDDIKANARKSDDHSTEFETLPFKKGTRNQYGKIEVGKHNDMLIYYYDLEGNQVMFKHPKKDQYLPLIRVRWQNPEAHKDKSGKPMKYQSPAGSGSHLYIPEAIRRKYKTRTPIDRLIIQEGEKKAEKACKHGLDSVGIMGIHNIATTPQLPEDLQTIIQECGVKEVFFLLDSDWQDIARSVKTGSIVTTRPITFFSAVRKYKEYMRTMYNVGAPVEIYFGYINQANQETDKGVDDLLTNTLKGRENELLQDFRYAINEKEGIGDWLTIHKITTLSDQQIADFWNLNDHKKFYQQHKAVLQPLKEFRFKKIQMRINDDGDIELAQKINADEKFWTCREDKNGNDVYNFDYVNCFNFLRNRGFGRFEMKSGEFEFVHIENRVVRRVDQYKIKDYITEFVETIKEKDVLNMLYRGGPQYLGQEKLSNLKYLQPVFDRATAKSQSFYFQNSIWEISADGIKAESHARMKAHIWGDRLIQFDAKVTEEPLITVKYNQEHDTFGIAPTETGLKCDFLQFLINTSNFAWKKMKKGEDVTPEEEADISRHIINKLTAIGYMLHDFKNDSELVAVVAMDGKLSEVGASNGRSGKSLVGVAIEQMVPQVYIPAKDPKITEDRFIFAEVSERTKNVFIDDCRVTFDFEFLFPYITGKFKVNPKGGQPFTLNSQNSPKFYIPTNHSMMGEGGSFKDRQAFMVFSDFYNEYHKPTDDFGSNFWSDWNNEQWNLFYNLMATCVQLYLKSKREGWAGKNRGIVIPPLDNVNLRKLRQKMGEDFIQWADEFFMEGGKALNQRMARKEVYEAFLNEKGMETVKKFYKAKRFGECVRAYCQFKGYHFNPEKPNEKGIMFPEFHSAFPESPFIGETDKSGGLEYFTLADDNWTGTF